MRASIIKGTFHGERGTSYPVFRRPLEGFSWEVIPCTLHSYAKIELSLVTIDEKLRALGKRSNFSAYVGFHLRDFPENSQLA